MNYEVLWFSPVCERIAPSTRGARIISNLSTFTKETAVMAPKGSWRSHGTQHFKKMLLKIAYFYCQTQNSYNYSAHNTFFCLFRTFGTPTFFSWSLFPRQKCLHTFPLRRKKSAATTKIPSVRHFQNLKSAFWEADLGESLRRRRIFFFGGEDFFFFPT